MLRHNRWVIDLSVWVIGLSVRLAFGGPWLGLQLCRQIGLTDFIERTLPTGQEEIPWPVMAQILILARLCHPSSELHIAEHFYESSALSDLLGVPVDKVNEDRLYRALDQLLPHKEGLEKHLKNRLGELFELDYDLLLYDVTSTYFEGEAKQIPLAQRGYSRDHRPDCKQVNIALVVSREGLPLGYELFAGNRNDVTTLEEIVERIERLYGKAQRIWVMDRGMISEENVRYLQEAGRRYIVGTPKSMLRRFERELLAKDWYQVHEGLEVRFCPTPGGQEIFLLCRSAQRREKEHAIHERFEKRIEEGLEKIAASCRKRKQGAIVVAERVGRLVGSELAGGRSLRGPDRARCQRICEISLEENRPLARMGTVKRGMLSATEQCDGLESAGALASVHSADRGRGCLSHSEVGSATSADLAQETETGRSAYPGVFRGLRVVEDPGATLSACRVGRRTAKSFSGTGGGNPG